ncbi:MAG: hypothetical protein BWY63_03818 [Chloroflexi bacterium ADurb.Bin360]|nr:MAG: hypothetical protein BWY63_03818 [Chloroflexi bacterium ADurb.Bin360]
MAPVGGRISNCPTALRRQIDRIARFRRHAQSLPQAVEVPKLAVVLVGHVRADRFVLDVEHKNPSLVDHNIHDGFHTGKFGLHVDLFRQHQINARAARRQQRHEKQIALPVTGAWVQQPREKRAMPYLIRAYIQQRKGVEAHNRASLGAQRRKSLQRPPHGGYALGPPFPVQYIKSLNYC